MARRPRLQFPGAVYHVMSRGNRKSAIFTTDDDRRRFMNVLGEVAQTYHVRVYAALLMDTHYHLILDTPRGNLSAMMRQLNGVYAQDNNRCYALTGHTFEARFHSIVVQRERYLRMVARYVVLNPVKAQLCARRRFLALDDLPRDGRPRTQPTVARHGLDRVGVQSDITLRSAGTVSRLCE